MPAGRPTFVPSAQQRAEVQMLAGIGTPFEDIRSCVINPSTGKAVSPMTLRREFREELALAKTKMNMRVAASLYRMATTGDTAAAIFWMKARAGWRQTDRHEVTGPDGQPIQMAHQDAYDLRRLSNDELAQFEALLGKATATAQPIALQAPEMVIDAADATPADAG